MITTVSFSYTNSMLTSLTGMNLSACGKNVLMFAILNAAKIVVVISTDYHYMEEGWSMMAESEGIVFLLVLHFLGSVLVSLFLPEL